MTSTPQTNDTLSGEGDTVPGAQGDRIATIIATLWHDLLTLFQ